MSVDTALQQRETAGNPIRIGMIGAGATGRAIALQLGLRFRAYGSLPLPIAQPRMPSEPSKKQDSRSGFAQNRLMKPKRRSLAEFLC
jgi:hypothetical protein